MAVARRQEEGFLPTPLDSNPGARARPTSKTRIAILGGGPSALTCAWYLTSHRALRDKYEVTIYTMGWKLGGKGSSGRGDYGRIQEHGLHVLFGSYHSFFRTMRACYDELDRPPGHPLATWRDAFKPHDFGVVEDEFDGVWRPWLITFPRNSAVPGDRGTALSSSEYLSMAIQSLMELLFGWRALHEINESSSVFATSLRPNDGPDLPVRAALALVREVLSLAHGLAHGADRIGINRLVRALRALIWPAMRRLSQINYRTHRFWLAVDFLTAFLGGLIDDGVLEDGGFAAIDDLDFRAWLQKHGAHEDTLQSPWARTIYDAAFAYAGGDPHTQRVAAGVAAHLLLGFGMYRESMYFKMQAGMGDAVFAPLYLMLKQRGVRFEFFHKVESLHLDDTKRRIERVRVTRQVELQDNQREYQPLVDINGLECWPAEPLYEQIKDAGALAGVDLESYYQRSPNGSERDLVAGQHFDRLVFAIPIGAVPFLCRELLDHSERWREMTEHVTSVQTVSFQTWTKKDLAALGWPYPSPLLSLYVEPLNTWADMSQVIDREAWPEHLAPRTISYYTGPQPGPKFAPEPHEEPDFERTQYDRAKELALEYLRTSLTTLMPDAAASTDGPAMNWNLLVDPQNRKGEARFDAQYWRSNCGPSERCTLANPGSIQHRMEAGDTGYDNLTVTGDWIDNGIYAACMEGAFNSGILAARALCGWPFEIDGLGYSPTKGPLHPEKRHRVELPRDDGVIDDVEVQWWYWTGHLTSTEGRAFGFEVVFFVVAAMHDWASATMGQAAITDIHANRFVGRELEAPGRPKPIRGQFDLDVGEISAKGGSGTDHLRSQVQGYSLDLQVREAEGAVVHYGGRDHRYAFGGDTCYYSRPLMAGNGSITTPDGHVHDVSGDLWFDRQWGKLVPAVMIGWQWFAIQLDRDTQIMLFAFNDERDEWTGTITRKGKPAMPLHSHDFEIEILGWWQSPHTAHDYPHGWKVSVAGEELFIHPLVADQEMTAGFWIGPRYWEGACSVSGSRTGRAYVELTGFGARRVIA